MGLDIYVGSFTRYYCGDWELSAAQAARDLGAELLVVRSEPGIEQGLEPAIADAEEVQSTVHAWRAALVEALSLHFDETIDWNESPLAPYFTLTPGWDGFADLLLWAAYDEHPELERPDGHREEWGDDAAYLASNQPGFESRYSGLLHAPEIWLPVQTCAVFEAPDIAERPRRFGSSICLLRQLDDLHVRSWQADDATLESWSRAGSEFGAPLESGARYALALFTTLARQAVEHRLPMLLDY